MAGAVSEFISSLYFEKQEDDNMCAQHCINSLLQKDYFTPVNLAEIAKALDNQEKEQYLSAGVDNPDYLRCLAYDSHNMDDSGFFSIQVITRALEQFNLTLMPITSKDAGGAMDNPQKEKAFICHYQQHWLTLRKFGQQWINLNSYEKKPVLITDTYLSIFMTQLKHDGYSLFVIKGELPLCLAEQLAITGGIESLSDEKARRDMPVNFTDSFELQEQQQIEEALRRSLEQIK